MKKKNLEAGRRKKRGKKQQEESKSLDVSAWTPLVGHKNRLACATAATAAACTHTVLVQLAIFAMQEHKKVA